MLPSSDKLYGDADLIFQQDLAPAHTAKGTKSWFNDHDVTVLDWPANSPDLNPIENLWGIVRRKMRDTRPNNADELKATVKETWASIPPQQCHKLITSMPRRIEAVIKAKGAIAYRPLVKAIKPGHKQIQVWPEGLSEALQDCFDTDWDMFKQAATYNNTTDLQEYSETVTAYITKCIDDVTVTKTITVRANQKPWLTGEVYRLLKARNAAFRAGDEEGLKTARANLSRGIREAKRQYSRRIAHRFSDSRDTRSLWQGIQIITDYKPPPQTCDSTIPLLNELNAFFARFEYLEAPTKYWVHIQ